MEPIRILRVIARLNMGGPAIQAITLTSAFRSPQFHSILATGQCAPGEEEMSTLLAKKHVKPERIPGLGRAIRASDDLRAFWHLSALIRRFRPQIVHTHTAKAGTLGRVSSLFAKVPVRIHTFHGHVFAGYFSSWMSRAVIQTERLLSKISHRVIVISKRQEHELGAIYQIAAPRKIALVPLGFELEPFLAVSKGEVQGTLREEIGLSNENFLVGIVGRIAPIKNHTNFLTSFAKASEKQEKLHAIVIGDGKEDYVTSLKQLTKRLGIEKRVHWLGYRTNLLSLYADLDLIALSSDNEGTPVALIEALACGIPCLSTEVGGVSDVLGEGRYGVLVPPRNPEKFSEALLSLAANAEQRQSFRELGPETARARYGFQRLVDDLSQLYQALLAQNL